MLVAALLKSVLRLVPDQKAASNSVVCDLALRIANILRKMYVQLIADTTISKTITSCTSTDALVIMERNDKSWVTVMEV